MSTDRLLLGEPGIVSEDSVVLFEATPTDTTTVTPPSNYFPASTGASALAATGIDGRAVTVAVLDTGISAKQDYAGRVVGGIDLSGEGSPYKDNFGHGTFIAGLVAGNGASSNGAYAGEAPGANLVSIKVAGASGTTSVSTVISGIDWAIKQRDRLGIKVLNMSLGADPTESTTTSPLNAAVERAWAAGITVVVSAGNYGPGNGSISKPGDDPLVVTVGATDEVATIPTSDDAITSFSSVGPTWTDGWFKPDLVAPGRTVVSLRVPGSTIDSSHPEGRVGSNNFKGSGTSFSAAITSGAAALIYQANPGSTPDDIKGRLLAHGSEAAGRQSLRRRPRHPRCEDRGHRVRHRVLAEQRDPLGRRGSRGERHGRLGTDMGRLVLERLVLERQLMERFELERFFVERKLVERQLVERKLVERKLVERFELERFFMERKFVERFELERVVVERQLLERFELERLVVERQLLERLVLERTGLDLSDGAAPAGLPRYRSGDRLGHGGGRVRNPVRRP